jgi:hypothetical protein
MENDCSRIAGAPLGFVGSTLPRGRDDYLGERWCVGAIRKPSAKNGQRVALFAMVTSKRPR